jgi:hypothetical protein
MQHTSIKFVPAAVICSWRDHLTLPGGYIRRMNLLWWCILWSKQLMEGPDRCSQLCMCRRLLCHQLSRCVQEARRGQVWCSMQANSNMSASLEAVTAAAVCVKRSAAVAASNQASKSWPI